MGVMKEAYSENWHMFSTNNFEEALYYIHIAFAKKILYVESPKVASTTLKRSLMKFEWGSHKEMSFEDIHDRKYSPLLNFLQVPSLQNILQDQNFIKVALVRDPFVRTLAAYLDQIKNKNSDRLSNIIPFLGCHRHDMWIDVTFPDFVDAICRQPVSLMDPHWRPQYHQIYADHIKFDKIGKMENIDGFFEYLEKQRPGIKEYIERDNYHRSNAGSNIKDFYNKKLIDRIAEKYRVDFEYFGYDASIR